MTDADGHVSIPIPTMPSLSRRLGARRRLRQPRGFNWRGNENVPIPGNLTMKLERATTIRGKVVDDQNTRRFLARRRHHHPQPGSKSLRRRSQFGRLRIGENRRRRHVDVMPRAGGDLRDRRSACGITSMPAAMGGLSVQEIHSAQARDGSATSILARGNPIEGVVHDQDGKPIKGARVMYGGDMASNKMDPQKTGDDGKFAYAAKAGDEVVLTVTCKGICAGVADDSHGR